MSERHRVQDGTGVISSYGANTIVDVIQNVAPTNGKAGYAPGCSWRNTAGTVGTTFYVNVGTALSSDWLTVEGAALATGAGAGVTSGTGTIYKTSVGRDGGIYTVRIMIDLTGLQSSTTDLDIIGTGTSPAHIGLLTAREAGATVLIVSMQCWEAPATGVTDIDLYSATEGTGVFDDAVTGLTETALITSGGAWTNGRQLGCTTVPLSTEYLYLTCGAAGTVGTYTAGKFLITLMGY